MKSSLSMVVLSGALLAATMVSPVFAAPQKPVSKMTCEEFVVLEDALKPKVAYWADGFDSKGKLVDAVANIDETDKMLPELITECQKTPKASFLKKLRVVRKHYIGR